MCVCVCVREREGEREERERECVCVKYEVVILTWRRDRAQSAGPLVVASLQ